MTVISTLLFSLLSNKKVKTETFFSCSKQNLSWKHIWYGHQLRMWKILYQSDTVFAGSRNCRNYGNLNNRRLIKLSLPRNKIETHKASYSFQVYIIMIQYWYVFWNGQHTKLLQCYYVPCTLCYILMADLFYNLKFVSHKFTSPISPIPNALSL